MTDRDTKASLAESLVEIIVKLGGDKSSLVGDHIITNVVDLVKKEMLACGKLAPAFVVFEGYIVGIFLSYTNDGFVLERIADVIHQEKDKHLHFRCGFKFKFPVFFHLLLQIK